MPLDSNEEKLLEENPLLRVAVFGVQTQEFLNTDIGRYLVQCARIDYDAALESLKSVSPWRRRKIQELQNKAKVAENFLGWLDDAIQSGKQAEVQIHER